MKYIKRTPEEISVLLKRAERLVAAGATLGEAARKLGVKYATLHNWRRRQTGTPDPAGRVKELELENRRLRKVLRELQEELGAKRRRHS